MLRLFFWGLLLDVGRHSCPLRRRGRRLAIVFEHDVTCENRDLARVAGGGEREQEVGED